MLLRLSFRECGFSLRTSTKMRRYVNNNALDLCSTFLSTLHSTHYSFTTQSHWWWEAPCAALGLTDGSLAANQLQPPNRPTSTHIHTIQVKCLAQRAQRQTGMEAGFEQSTFLSLDKPALPPPDCTTFSLLNRPESCRVSVKLKTSSPESVMELVGHKVRPGVSGSVFERTTATSQP